MTEKKVVDEILEQLTNLEIDREGFQVVMVAHTTLLALHTKALCCHSECLGMNAANSHAVCMGLDDVPYDNNAYMRVMTKWDMIDGGGQPLI